VLEAMSSPRIAWLRIGDLRLRDNPALYWAAFKNAGPTVPIFVWCPEEEKELACPSSSGAFNWGYEGTALQAALIPALRQLDLALARHQGGKGSRLRLLQQAPGAAEAVVAFARSIGAREIHLNRREEPCERQREQQLQSLAAKEGIQVSLHSAFLFRDPERCRIFQAVQRGMHIFKAFWAGWHEGGEIRKAVPEPPWLRPLEGEQTSLPFAGEADQHWPLPGLMPASRVNRGASVLQDSKRLEELWVFSEEAAWEALEQFRKSNLNRYHGSITRDAGPKAKESKLSPYFRLGLLSMVDVWWMMDRSSDEARKWFRRCAWRDYAYWMLHYWPSLPEEPMRMAFREMQWLRSSEDNAVEAWRNGLTGFPLVDAGMRELKQTGYLQQNLRHTVGQFLVETLGVDWRVGEEWFHISLVDSDLAINSMMWQHQGLTGVSQWLIGIDCHPVRHARNADPKGDYVRTWLPELAQLPLKYLHCPWEAPADVLKMAGVKLGVSYPHRVVDDVDAARSAFLSVARQCRAAAPAECFSSDGCDLLALPTEPSPLRMERGIWALTERRLRDQGPQHGRPPSGKGKGKGSKGNGKGSFSESHGGKGAKREAATATTKDPEAEAQTYRMPRRWQRATGA